MSEVKLSAQPRSEFGKGAARRLRQANQVPAVLYGHGTDPVHVTLPGHATMLALKQANVLLSIELEGTDQLALPKDVQRNPLRGWIEHVDLLLVKRGEKVTVDIPVVVTGDARPGTLVNVESSSLSIEAEATNIPVSIEVDVEGLNPGTTITAGELTLPAGSTLIGDADAPVVVVSDNTGAAGGGEEQAEEPAAAAADAS